MQNTQKPSMQVGRVQPLVTLEEPLKSFVAVPSGLRAPGRDLSTRGQGKSSSSGEPTAQPDFSSHLHHREAGRKKWLCASKVVSVLDFASVPQSLSASSAGALCGPGCRSECPHSPGCSSRCPHGPGYRSGCALQSRVSVRVSSWSRV